MYDIAIIGAGPAGLSAAITARARNRSVAVISNPLDQNRLARSEWIGNYPGLPEVSGSDLLQRFFDQAQQAGAEFVWGRAVGVLRFDDHCAITTASDLVEARALILASGIPVTKGLPGEREYLGRGVSYCATCDGALYRGRTVCVVGLSPKAPEEALFLAGLDATVVYLAEKEPQELEGKVSEIRVGRALAVEGDALGVRSVLAAESGEEVRIPCEGVFILRPSIAPDALVPGLSFENSFIATDRDLSTSVPGVFAAGDCVGKPAQIAKAVGEGQVAAFSADIALGARA